MTAISFDQFEAARRHDWDFEKLVTDKDTQQWVLEAVAQVVRR